MHWVPVWFLVGKLRFHMPRDQKTKIENRSNIVTSSKKTLKMLTSKNKKVKSKVHNSKLQCYSSPTCAGTPKWGLHIQTFLNILSCFSPSSTSLIQLPLPQARLQVELGSEERREKDSRKSCLTKTISPAAGSLCWLLWRAWRVFVELPPSLRTRTEQIRSGSRLTGPPLSVPDFLCTIKAFLFFLADDLFFLFFDPLP